MLPNASGRWTVDMHWFRTLLHLPLYFFLGGVVYYAFSRFWMSVGICAIVAIADEMLKIFLPTREFGAVDLIFDTVGFLLGIAIVFFIKMLFKNS
jgi:VanZ family protein